MNFDEYINELKNSADVAARRAEMFRKMKEDISSIPYEWVFGKKAYACEHSYGISGHLLNEPYYDPIQRASVFDYHRILASTFTDHITEQLLKRNPAFASRYLTGIDMVPDVYATMFDDLLFGKHAEFLPPSQGVGASKRHRAAVVHLVHFFGRSGNEEGESPVDKLSGQFIVFSGLTEKRADGLFYIKRKLDQRVF